MPSPAVPFWLNGCNTIATKVSIFNALQTTGVHFSRFCYSESLTVAGNCRACLLEVQQLEKPVPSCVADLEAGQGLWPESIFSEKSKEGVFEVLLANHPLDCPICDQGGECDLQDQSKTVGGDRSRMFSRKRGVFDKNCSFIIKAIMTRCIHCTRCVRFNNLLGDPRMGILLRGTNSAIGTYIYKPTITNLLGNVIDLCPVGALTARSQAFSARSWETSSVETIDLLDGFGASIYLLIRNNKILRVLPKPNKSLNGNFITDTCRFSLSIKTKSFFNTYFFNSGSQCIEILSWKNWFIKTDQLIPCYKIVVLLEENLNIESLELIKKIINKSNRVQAVFFLQNKLNKNIYWNTKSSFYGLFSKKIFTLVFFAANLKIEAALLNFKLKLKLKKTLFSIFTLGSTAKTNMRSNFIGCSLKNLKQILEGKLFLAPKNLLNGAFLQGKSFMSKGIDLNSYLPFLQEKIKTVTIITINLFCNEEGALFLNLKSHSLKEKYLTFSFQNKDTLALRKLTNLIAAHIFWFNILRPKNLKICSLIPISDWKLAGGAFFSQKLQKTKKNFPTQQFLKSGLEVFSAFFQLKNTNSPSLNFIFDDLLENLHFSLFFVKKNIDKLTQLKSETLTGWEQEIL